ncbi:hypothetical protein AM1BK_22370 [Neobacillus kokaensis]|uniref:Uncharacterized protein n=1 Tax=Neobacillus kokaensis TaxID=2759023 RepID=A0ABQ3N288_9BACI|nr:hypothetical protein AM1BK_22370 [Neobacillus kokaensis]
MKVDEELDVVDAVQGDQLEFFCYIDEKKGKKAIENSVKQDKLFKIAVRKFQQPHRNGHIRSDTPRQLVFEK